MQPTFTFPRRAALACSLFALYSPVAGQSAKHPIGLHFKQLGDLVPEGSDVATIERCAGRESKFEIHKLTARGFDVDVSSTPNVDMQRTMFFVVGMKSLAQFDEFLEHPERWTWTKTTFGLLQGEMSIHSRFFPAGDPPVFRGKVLDPFGKPLQSIGLRAWGIPPSQPDREIRVGLNWGYDPETGRFWAMPNLAGKKADYEYKLDVLPHAEHAALDGLNPDAATLAPRLRYAWPRYEDVTVVLPKGGNVKVNVIGISSAQTIEYSVRLLHTESKASLQPFQRQPRSEHLAFYGIPAGTYTLDVRAGDTEQPLYRTAPFSVRAGETFDVPRIDLRDLVQAIQVSVVDAHEQPVDAHVAHVRLDTSSAQEYSGYTGSKTGPSGSTTLLVPKTGASILVTAPGFGDRVYDAVREDLVVRLEKPHKVTVRIETEDVDVTLLEDLYLVARPTAGFPRWANSLFLQRTIPHRRTSDATRSPCTTVASLAGQGEHAMLIPFSGAWHFELAYMRHRGLVAAQRITLPLMDAIPIERSRELTIGLPVKKLRRAVQEYEEARRRR
ncbi:MAG: hypothetical protein KDC95_05190 [Planctomycetes bacterium]|nr:hypothetical protein [Planctomycetota bacterium]